MQHIAHMLEEKQLAQSKVEQLRQDLHPKVVHIPHLQANKETSQRQDKQVRTAVGRKSQRKVSDIMGKYSCFAY